MQADSAAGEEILLGWLSWTPINPRRKLRSPPKIANVNRWIFDCTGHFHIAAVSSALRYREVVLRRGYRGVHTLYDRPYGTLTGGCTTRPYGVWVVVYYYTALANLFNKKNPLYTNFYLVPLAGHPLPFSWPALRVRVCERFLHRSETRSVVSPPRLSAVRVFSRQVIKWCGFKASYFGFVHSRHSLEVFGDHGRLAWSALRWNLTGNLPEHNFSLAALFYWS